MERTFDGVSKLGNLVTDLIDMAYPDHDFVLLNEGGFRSIWLPGVLQYQHFYNMFPFSNRLISFEMTGHELIKTLEILQSGKKGFYPTKKLKQHIRVNKDGSRELINATFIDGCQIEPGKSYRGVSLYFFIDGGDDFQYVKDNIYTLRK